MSKKNEQESVIDYASEVSHLTQELTKRNQAYIFELDKILSLNNLSEDKRYKIKYEMMSELVAHQKSGKTAKQLYGTVSQCAKSILEGPKEDLTKPSEDWKLYLDGALLMGSFFMLISVFTSAQQLGIVTLLLNYFVAGFAVLFVTKASQNFQEDTRLRKARWKSLLKYLGMTLLSMIIWLGGMLLVTLIPEGINPVLPKNVYLVIGAITLVLKFYLKKKLNIRGGIF
ncbi:MULTISPECIES: DUF1129 domain-containing protein [unclassified Granulicatella]|uniref:DUF1129 domain-containing protein n=1 Tax=unclassified Granulicatella TaxID=2630493 RepID=UPI001074265A|nr:MULTISPECIES: DUF1129 family protein [unclassified Granulicatella]MBF0780946.1 DUF1129 family protein [Granulicatella sp. 19428wC4_WM01]TFU92988.1 DUF1129 family protein [Granulicatella sp. WM01]